MNIKLRTAILSIFIFCFCFSDVLAAGLALPLPDGTIKISEKTVQSGLVKTLNRRYVSDFDKDALSAFYRQEMLKAGWKERKGGSFVKDDNMAVIIIYPARQSNGKTAFTVSTFKLDKKDDFLAMRKKDPDKLKFMPVYPGSMQIFLWDFSNGSVAVKYSAQGRVKDAAFFYKAGMLNYGWALDSENSTDKKAKTAQINLVFRKSDKTKKEICKIEITEMSSLNKIFISVSYYVHKAHKKIKR